MVDNKEPFLTAGQCKNETQETLLSNSPIQSHIHAYYHLDSITIYVDLLWFPMNYL